MLLPWKMGGARVEQLVHCWCRGRKRAGDQFLRERTVVMLVDGATIRLYYGSILWWMQIGKKLWGADHPSQSPRMTTA